MTPVSAKTPLPPLALALMRALLPRAERDEVIADLAAEYARHRETLGETSARRWLWRQTFASLPSLFRWNWWRGRTGFEPRANAFRPGGYVLNSLLADARYAARRLLARPTYTILAVLTLALGIGGTAAVYGIARGLIFEPLPYANADEVAIFWFGGSWNEKEFVTLRGSFPGFRSVAFYREGSVTMRDGDAPARLIPAVLTSTELFGVLGARPIIGRGFAPGEDASGAEPVAVLSYGLWQELGGDRSILGQRITLDGTPRTVIGVMPRGFWFPSPEPRIWVPLTLNPQGQNGSYALVGHVSPGLDPAHMTPQVAELMRMLDERFEYSKDWDKTRGGHVTPIRDDLLGPMRPALYATLVAMGLILLIGCANVAALMLGQVEGRTAELAVRSALGANHVRLTQQLVVESLFVGILAAALGAGLAASGFRVLADALPLGAWAESAVFDWRMFASALLIAVVSVLLVAVVPVTALWRGDLRGALSRARTGGIQGRGGRLERGLVVTQVALAMLIASGAALLVRSVAKLYAIEPGIVTEGVAVIDIVPSAGLTSAQRGQAMDEMMNALRQLPGVRSVSGAMKLPLRGSGNSFGITIPGRPDLEATTTYFRIVAPDYLETMGIRLREGRNFTSADLLTNATAAPTEIPILVNRELERRYFPGESALGRVVGGGFGINQRIVGIVDDVVEGDLTEEAKPARYYLAGSVAWWGGPVSLVFKTARPEDATALLDEARQSVQRAAPSYAVHETTTMDRVRDIAVGPARQVMMLLTLLCALALVLGAIGIYGVISHFAARRKRDWAIRMALGLPGTRVVRHIVGQGAGLVTAGIVVGAIGTLALARLLASFLFGVSTVDPLAFAAASLLLLGIGVMAAFFPARRAGTVDPAIALREQ